MLVSYLDNLAPAAMMLAAHSCYQDSPIVQSYPVVEALSSVEAHGNHEPSEWYHSGDDGHHNPSPVVHRQLDHIRASSIRVHLVRKLAHQRIYGASVYFVGR